MKKALEQLFKRVFALIAAIFLIMIIFLTLHSFLTDQDHDFDEILETEACDITRFVKNQSKYVQNGTLEHVTFSSQQSLASHKRITRHGIFLNRPHARATVLICHGFMCNKFDAAFLRMLFPDYNVFIFDFRAHGEHIDEDQYCTFGKDEAYDVRAAVEYLKLREDVKSLPIVGYGFSMGAVAAIQAQFYDPSLFDLMILDCPYDYSSNVIKRGLANMRFNLFGRTFSLPGRSFLEQYAFHPYIQSFLKSLLKTVANMDATAINTQIHPLSPAESIKKVVIPCFFIHCKHDEKISVAAAKKLFYNACGYKRLWLTAGRRHFDSFFYNPEKYMYKINNFITDVLDDRYKDKIQEKIIEDVC